MITQFTRRSPFVFCFCFVLSARRFIDATINRCTYMRMGNPCFLHTHIHKHTHLSHADTNCAGRTSSRRIVGITRRLIASLLYLIDRPRGTRARYGISRDSFLPIDSSGNATLTRGSVNPRPGCNLRKSIISAPVDFAATEMSRVGRPGYIPRCVFALIPERIAPSPPRRQSCPDKRARARSLALLRAHIFNIYVLIS